MLIKNACIENNEELKQISDGIKYLEGVYKGEIKFEPDKEE